MKDIKAGQIIILTAFALICISGILWFFTGDLTAVSSDDNRVLAEKPELTMDSYDAFSEDYTAYYNDHMPFRSSLIRLNARIDYSLFNTSSSDYVIIGEDKWLFYSRNDDGDPLGCYEGTNLLTPEQLEELTDNCLKMRDQVDSMGKEFVIMIAPNKERVYSEYMPERFGEPAVDYRALQIYKYLKANTDIRVIYVYDELMDAKDKIDEDIWYKTDTHWNKIGGYEGARALMRELGVFMPAINSHDITIRSVGDYTGDLAEMAKLGEKLGFTDTEYSVEGYDDHEREEIEWDFNGMIRYRAKGADPRSIYVIRDSFASNLAPYIGSAFDSSYLRHKDSYTYEDLLSCDPDIVVYETVERYADGLFSFSVMPTDDESTDDES